MALTGIVIGGTTGTGSVGVPDVLDLTQADAESKLRAFDLVPRIQTIEAEGTEGTVFSQNPAARTIRARGTAVTLLVIRAPVVPPNLGQQLSDLQASVDDLSVKVDGVDTKVDAVDIKIDDVGTKIDDVDTKVDDVSAKIDGLATSVAAVETDASAATRNQAILDKLGDLAKAGGGTPGKSPGASRSGA
jgi:outer membrane murein-binding lipoprotein Lpp